MSLTLKKLEHEIALESLNYEQEKWRVKVTNNKLLGEKLAREQELAEMKLEQAKIELAIKQHQCTSLNIPLPSWGATQSQSKRRTEMAVRACIHGEKHNRHSGPRFLTLPSWVTTKLAVQWYSVAISTQNAINSTQNMSNKVGVSWGIRLIFMSCSWLCIFFDTKFRLQIWYLASLK